MFGAQAGSSLFINICGGLCVLGITGLAAYFRKKFKTLDDVVNVMGTREPSELEPHPPKGLIDQVFAATAETGENTNAVLAMTVRQGQANGTMKTIMNVQEEQGKMMNRILSTIEGVVEAGAVVKLDLDTEQTKVATVAQESQIALLDAVHREQT